MLKVLAYEPPTPMRFSLVIEDMRNSWESWERGDSATGQNGHYYYLNYPRSNAVVSVCASSSFDLGDADRALAQRLINTGPDHGKFIRQLGAYVRIEAPDYFWREWDTYVIGVASSDAPDNARIMPGDVTTNSTSRMHTLAKQAFSADMFCLDDVDADTQAELLALLNRMRDRWLDAGKRKGPEATEWRGMIQVSPDGWIYRRGISLNYQVLRSMYHARRNHRLIEWRQLCAWIETLPYAFLMTDCG